MTKELDERSRKLGSSEGALLTARVRRKHDDYLKMRRAVSAARTDLDLTALPRAQTAAAFGNSDASSRDARDRRGHFSAACLGDLEPSTARGLLRVKLEHARDNDALGTRGAAVVDAPPPDVRFDRDAAAAATAALRAAVASRNVDDIRACVDGARATPGCAAPDGTPTDFDWCLRDVATAALVLRDLDASAAETANAKSDAAQLAALPPLRAEHVGRDADANCYWAFRGEREYKYAPHRVWIQQAPRDAPAVPPQPSWGYFGDDACVQTLANSLDDADASETKLKRDLLARLP